MSKISKFRLVNISYENQIVIDETFDCKDTHSVLLLENGGGKSVFVQLLSSLFTQGRKRNVNFKKRRFADYFDDKKPSVIMVEWSLENPNKKYLVGALIKKETNENNEVKLKEYDFTLEYPKISDGHYTIDNLSFIEADEKGNKSIKSFDEILALFKELSSKNSSSFRLFNRESSKHKEYFNDLKEHNISKVEWETVIKDINETEGGLVKLYNQYKTSNQLLENCILPIIEEHIVGEEEKTINVLRSSFEKYLKGYEENQSFEENKKVADQFLKDINALKLEAEELTEDSNKLEILKTKIENYLKYTNYKKQLLIEEIALVDGKINDAYNNLEHLDHEEVSYDYVQNKKKRDLVQEELKQLEERSNQLKKEREEVEYIIELHKNLERIEAKNTKEKRLHLKEAEIKSILSQNEQDKAVIEKYGSILNTYYSFEKEKVEKDKNEEALKLAKVEEDLKAIYNEKINAQKEQRKLDKLDSQLNSDLKHYDQEEEDFKNKYNYPLNRLLTKQYEDGLLERLEESQGKEIVMLEDRIVALKEEEDTLEKEHEELIKYVEGLKRTKSDLIKKEEQDQKLLEKQISELEDRAGVWKSITDEIIPIEELYSKDILLDRLEKLKEDKTRASFKMEADKIELKERLELIEKGIIINPPKDFNNALSNFNFYQGLDFIRKTKNRELLEKNPLLAYSIVLENKNDLEKVKNIKSKESFILPMCTVDDVNKPIEVPDNIVTYFNEDLLDDTLKDQFELDISSLTDRIEMAKEDILVYKEYLDKINRQQASIEDKVDLEEALTTLRKDLVDTDKELKEKSSKLEDLKKQVKDIKAGIDSNKNWLALAKNKKNEFLTLKSHYLEYLKNLERKNDTRVKLKEMESLIEKLSENSQIGEKNKEGLKDKISQLDMTMRELNTRVRKYSSYLKIDVKELQGISIETCEIEFDVHQRKLDSSNLKGLEDDVEDLKKEIEGLEEQISIEKFTQEDLNTSYSKPTLERSEAQLVELKSNISSTDSKLTNSKVEEGKISSKIEGNEKDLKKIGKEDFLEEHLIRNIDFEESKKIQRVELETYKNNKVALEKNVDALDKIPNAFYEISKSLDGDTDFSEEYGWHNLDIPEFTKLTDTFKGEERELREKFNAKQEELRENAFSKIEVYMGWESYTGSLDRICSNVSNPKDLMKSIDNDVSLIEESISVLTSKLEVNENLLNNLSTNSLDYIKLISKEIQSFANKTKLNGKDIIKVHCPIKKIEDEESIANYKEFYRDLAKDYVKMSIEDRRRYSIQGSLSTFKILEKYAYMDRFRIKVEKDKPEAFEEPFWEWENVVSFSGAEEVLGRFSIFVAISNYINKLNRRGSKALILDNPFANIQSDVKIEKLYKLADKANIQLICFTAMEIEKVISITPVIYKLGFHNISSNKREVCKALIKEDTML